MHFHVNAQQYDYMKHITSKILPSLSFLASHNENKLSLSHSATFWLVFMVYNAQ